jgi:hypothetical protein
MSGNIGHTMYIMTAIEKVRSLIDHDVFDYTQLMSALSDYSKPRDTVTSLLRQKKILRIKKGLYIFGDLWRRLPVCSEALAGLIYGPSAISLDYALAYYGLIPERIYSITSISTGRSRNFQTPIGTFSYRQQSSKRFSTGLNLQNNKKDNWFIVEPLKALADKVWCDPRCKPGSARYFSDYLFADLRIDENQLTTMIEKNSAEKIVQAYKSFKISLLFEFLNSIKTE